MTVLYAKQRGVGLVELMVAMVLSLFLLAGLFTIFFSTRQSYDTQQDLSRLHDNQRLAATMLAQTVQQAGYFPNPTTFTRAEAFPSNATFATAGQIVFGGNVTSEALAIRFVAPAAGGHMLNCQGGSANGATTDIYRIDYDSNIKANVLECSANGAAFQPLVNRVNTMQVLFGVDTNSNGSADRYMNAATVTANKAWANVKSVSLRLVFDNPLNKPQAAPGQPATIAMPIVVNLMSAPNNQ
ncbi:MAG: PilW family protein [Acidihalobacter sp.]|uniref:PilW family protein n=1 Tax=Acidihalobacter sp. TaxID=1872108 RepID=UPI00307ED144